jgi:hypothetical protein
VTKRQRFWVRHLVAAAGTTLVLPSLVIGFYLLLIIVTNDVGGPLALVLVPIVNCIATIAFACVLFPVMALLERLLIRTRPKWQRRVFSPLLAGALFGINALLVIAGFLFLIGTTLWGSLSQESATMGLFRFLFLGGTPLVLGVTLYWFLLRVGDRQAGSPGERDRPEQGLSQCP